MPMFVASITFCFEVEEIKKFMFVVYVSTIMSGNPFSSSNLVDLVNKISK